MIRGIKDNNTVHVYGVEMRMNERYGSLGAGSL